MHLILIGLRGAGKSRVGRRIAKRADRPFVDLDDVTLARLGAETVRDAWNSRGEPAFRAAEVEGLREVLRRERLVLALGGGTPTAPGAADLLREAQAGGRAHVVYLRGEPEALRARLRDAAGGAGVNRPSLTGADPLDEIDEVFAQRDPLYRSLADETLDAAAPFEAKIEALLRGVWLKG